MTGDIVRAFGIAAAAIVFVSLLRQYSPPLSVAVSFAAGIAVFFFALRAGASVFVFLNELAEHTHAQGFACLMKAAAIALISQFAQDTCRESGQAALAGQIEFAGKIGVLASAAPLFSELAQILLRYLQ